MLLLDTKIIFYRPENVVSALINDLSTERKLVPAINFGNDWLFSGTLILEKEINIIERGKYYRALIEMPTVDSEAYSYIKDLLKEDFLFKMQSGSKIVGEGKIIYFIYE